MIADFESGVDQNNVTGGRQGPWMNYNSASNKAPLSPTPNSNGSLPAASPGLSGSQYALHIKDGTYTDYCGFGAPFNGSGYTTATSTASPYDVSAYDGIKFDIQAGSSSQTRVFFEVETSETQPATAPGKGTATSTAVDEYNNRGYLLEAVGATPGNTSTALTTTTQTVYVPFSVLIPRWLPEPGTSGCGSLKCQAPAFVPAHALGMQFSVYNVFTTVGTYDLWVDNVEFYTGDNGLTPPGMTEPTFNDGAKGFSHCTRPTFLGGKSASGKYLMWAYNNWKNRYVKAASSGGNLVQSPEVNGGSVVSEGIAYGMLLSAYMGDSTLFAGLSKFWLAHSAVGTLMTWRYDITGTSSTGTGSATDADEDAAFAFLEASKTSWGASYASNATTMINDVWSHDIDTSLDIPTGGSNYANASSSVTNPSYFAPAMYREFAKVDTAHAWGTVADKTLSVLNTLANNVSSADGLVPAWCSNSCTAVGSNGDATDGIYQYDSHRVPWRVGTDYCWNGTAAAATYLSKISAFFSSMNGVAAISDMYNLNGSAYTSAEPNSMSIVGSAGVGALSSSTYSALSNSAWQFILDGENRASLDTVPVTGSTAYSYSYYNASVGLLTALTMSGNFYPM